MDLVTLLTILASIVAILGFLYLLFIGQKSLFEWWRERQDKISQSPEIQTMPNIILQRMIKGNRRTYLGPNMGLEPLARGIAYRYWGQTQQAKRFLKASVKAFQLSGNKFDLAQAYIALGDVARTERDLESALRWFEKAAVILKGLPQDQYVMLMYGSTLWAKAKVYLDRGELETAFEMLKEAREIVIDNGSSPWGLEICSQQFGRYYMEKEDYDRAFDLFQESLHYSEQSQLANLYRRAETLIYLAELCLRSPPHHHKLTEYLNEAEKLAAQERPPYHNILASVYRIRGQLHFRESDYQEAFASFFEACSHAVLYQPWFLDEILAKVQKYLRNLGLEGRTDLVREVCSHFRATWREMGLDQAPGGLRFMAALEEVCPD